VAFGTTLAVTGGGAASEQYFAAYLLEKSLSVDNVFVFTVLFHVLAVPAAHQRRVLFFGVVGALALRAGFIAAGATVLEDLSWMFYVFGAVVVVAGVRMARSDGGAESGPTLAIRLARRFLPMTSEPVGDRFLVRQRGRWVATPLLIALVAIEVTDIVFAVDSIPAVFGVTRDVFIVFTSNAFAILGLRSLYFVFAGATDRFPYLKYGLAGVLVFVGAKMLVQPVLHVPAAASLAVIAAALGGAMVASLRARRASGDRADQPADQRAGRPPVPGPGPHPPAGRRPPGRTPAPAPAPVRR
jgi:tellurite resistance protein TerC